MRSAGSPVRGSRICEYHLPLTMKPRWELPLVDTARSRILTVATGSVDSESAQGRGDAAACRGLATDSQVAADVQQHPVYAATWRQCRGAGAVDDVPLGDGIEAQRAIGQPLDRVRPRRNPPGRPGEQSPCLGKFGRFREAASGGGSGPEPESTSDPGIKRSAAPFAPGVAGGEDFEELRRKPHRRSGRLATG